MINVTILVPILALCVAALGAVLAVAFKITNGGQTGASELLCTGQTVHTANCT